MSSFDRLRFLLLQIRDSDDAMAGHEHECFARALEVAPDRITLCDLLTRSVEADDLEGVDVILIGGSGDYSVVSEDAWLHRALESLRRIYELRKPTFGSCWGFQAFARALGGRVVHDENRAEVGTHRLVTTPEAREDPVFGHLGPGFRAQLGHEDVVVELPPNAVLLASTDRVANQAYRLADAPVYCTQFHPELRSEDLLVRFATYPRYVERIARVPLEEFSRTVEESPGATLLLRNFVSAVIGNDLEE